MRPSDYSPISGLPSARHLNRDESAILVGPRLLYRPDSIRKNMGAVIDAFSGRLWPVSR